MLDNVTKQCIDTARNILVGKVPDPKSQVEQITIALIYKFMDDMDQEAIAMGGEASFFVGEYEKYAWTRMFDPRLGGFDMLALYSEAITRMNLNSNIPRLFRDIFKNAFLPYRDPETLKLFLKVINEFHYDHSEKLGDAFEYLLSVLGSQGDAGQFRTPRHIIEFMVQVVAPQKHEKILDPACGTAGFLISAYKLIKQQNTDKKPGDLLSVQDRDRLVENFTGYDIAPDMVRLSLANMYLHGFVDPKIYEYDTLTSEERWNEYTDVILANPPFMSPTGGIRPHKKFSVQSKRSEVLFVDYMAEHLTPTGRAAIIVPEGIIFQSGKAYKELRNYLVEKGFLWAVVSLPSGVFQPYSGVKTSILFLDKVLAKKTDRILFVKVENDGYGLGAQRRAIDKNDLPAAQQVMKSWQQTVLEKVGENFDTSQFPDITALLVEKSRLAENGEYNLTGERYIIVQKPVNQKFKLYSLKNITSRITDGSHFSPPTGNSGYPYITVKDISFGKIDFENCKFIDENQFNILKSNNCAPYRNDILFSKDGTIGKVALVDKDNDFVVLSSLAIISPDENQVLPKFLRSMLSSEEFIIKAIESKTGIAIRRIVLKTLKELKVPLPPKEIQQEIVDEIEGYQRIIDGACMVVDNWRPNIELELEEARKAAGVDEWESVRLGDVCEVISGQSPKGKYYNKSGDGLPFYQGKTEFSDTYLGEPKNWTTNVTKIALPDDILMSVRAPVGPVNISTQKICIGRGLAAIRPIESHISNKFVFYYLKSIEKDISGNSGAVFPSINRREIAKIPIPNIPIDIQNEIENKIENELSIVNLNKSLILSYENKIKRIIDGVWNE